MGRAPHSPSRCHLHSFLTRLLGASAGLVHDGQSHIPLSLDPPGWYSGPMGQPCLPQAQGAEANASRLEGRAPGLRHSPGRGPRSSGPLPTPRTHARQPQPSALEHQRNCSVHALPNPRGSWGLRAHLPTQEMRMGTLGPCPSELPSGGQEGGESSEWGPSSPVHGSRTTIWPG